MQEVSQKDCRKIFITLILVCKSHAFHVKFQFVKMVDAKRRTVFQMKLELWIFWRNYIVVFRNHKHQEKNQVRFVNISLTECLKLSAKLRNFLFYWENWKNMYTYRKENNSSETKHRIEIWK